VSARSIVKPVCIVLAICIATGIADIVIDILSRSSGADMFAARMDSYDDVPNIISTAVDSCYMCPRSGDPLDLAMKVLLRYRYCLHYPFDEVWLPMTVAMTRCGTCMDLALMLVASEISSGHEALLLLIDTGEEEIGHAAAAIRTSSGWIVVDPAASYIGGCALVAKIPIDRGNATEILYVNLIAFAPTKSGDKLLESLDIAMLNATTRKEGCTPRAYALLDQAVERYLKDVGLSNATVYACSESGCTIVG